MRFAVTNQSWTGVNHDANEDALVADPERGLFAVADGVGSTEMGEIASLLAVTSFHRNLAARLAQPGPAAVEQWLLDAFENVNTTVRRYGEKLHRRMCTTLTAAVIVGDTLYIGHSGDSQAYLIDGAGAQLLTDDHTMVGQLVREGLISVEDAADHPRGGVLTRCVGLLERCVAQVTTRPARPGQRVVLMTDGVGRYLTPEQIMQTPSATALVEASRDAGSKDDLTALTVELKEDW